MKIINLQAENVKRLRAVEIRPSGNVVIIGGENEQGKTSVLDSIEMALAGGASIPAKPIREGATRAKIVAVLDDLVVKRTFTKSGSYLEVRSRDGAQAKSPQAMLDALVGRLSFDPLGFAKQKPEEQAVTLRQLVGLDVADLDKRAAALYDQRTVAGRELKKARGAYESAPSYPDAPGKESSAADLAHAWQEAREHNRAGKELEAEVQCAERDRAEAEKKVARLRQELADAGAELEARRRRALEVAEEVKTFVPADETAKRAAVDAAEGINAQVRANRARRGLAEDAANQQTEVDKLTAALDRIAEEKRERLAAAKWPIPGLALGATGVEYRGIPFAQCSSAQQLEVSVAMGLALNPKLRVLLIRDGSLLDEKHLAAIAAQAKAADAQIWIERVGDKDACAVVIEDGAVRGDVTPADELREEEY